MRANRKCSFPVQGLQSLGIQNDKSQNNFLMFRKDLTSKLIMLEMVCLVINQGLYGIIIVVNTRRK